MDCIKSDVKCERYRVCPAKDLWGEPGAIVSNFLSSEILDKLAEKTLELNRQEAGKYYIQVYKRI